LAAVVTGQAQMLDGRAIVPVGNYRDKQRVPRLSLKCFANNEIRLNVVRTGSNVPAKARFNLIAETQRSESEEIDCPKLRRKTILTKYAKRTIKEAGYICARDKHGETVFATATLPGSSLEAMRSLAENSGYAANLLTQWFRRHFAKPEYFYVWEWQKRGALHVHFVFQCSSAREAYKIERSFKKVWLQILVQVSEKSGRDIFERSDGGSWSRRSKVCQVKVVRHVVNAGRYLSKYLGKGSENSNMDSHLYPGRWWSVSYALLKKIREERVNLYSNIICETSIGSVGRDLASVLATLANTVRAFVNPYSNEDEHFIFYFAEERYKECKEVAINLFEAFDTACGITASQYRYLEKCLQGA
jgi:hypothetical protein